MCAEDLELSLILLIVIAHKTSLIDWKMLTEKFDSQLLSYPFSHSIHSLPFLFQLRDFQHEA